MFGRVTCCRHANALPVKENRGAVDVNLELRNIEPIAIVGREHMHGRRQQP
jgi:hypothetical protein